MVTKWTADRKAKFRATVAAKKAAKEGVLATHDQQGRTHRNFIVELLQHAEREITNGSSTKAQTYTELALDEMQGNPLEGQ